MDVISRSCVHAGLRAPRRQFSDKRVMAENERLRVPGRLSPAAQWSGSGSQDVHPVPRQQRRKVTAGILWKGRMADVWPRRGRVQRSGADLARRSLVCSRFANPARRWSFERFDGRRQSCLTMPRGAPGGEALPITKPSNFGPLCATAPQRRKAPLRRSQKSAAPEPSAAPVCY